MNTLNKCFGQKTGSRRFCCCAPFFIPNQMLNQQKSVHLCGSLEATGDIYPINAVGLCYVQQRQERDIRLRVASDATVVTEKTKSLLKSALKESSNMQLVVT